MSSYVSGALLGSIKPKTTIHIADNEPYITGSYVTVQQRTIMPGKTLFLEQLFCSAPTTGLVRITHNSDIIVISNTNPSQLFFDLKLTSPLPIAAGDTITIEFCARSGAFAGSANSFIHGYET